MVTGTTEVLVAELQAGRLDLGVVMEQAYAVGLDFEPAGLEELVAVVAPQHPLAHSTEADPQDLAPLPFALYSHQSAMQNLVDKWFAEIGVVASVRMRMDNVEALKSLVSTGIAASVMPVCTLRESPSLVAPVRIKDFPLHRRLSVAFPAGESMTRAARDLANILLQQLRSHRSSRSISLFESIGHIHRLAFKLESDYDPTPVDCATLRSRLDRTRGRC